MKLVTLNELVNLCAYWQRQLRLEDWTVRVAITPHHHFNGADAHTSETLRLKLADICLCDPAQHPNPEDYDMEAVLVHELLHLHFSPFMKDKGHPEEIPQEQAIDLLARSLVALNRGIRRGE